MDLKGRMCTGRPLARRCSYREPRSFIELKAWGLEAKSAPQEANGNSWLVRFCGAKEPASKRLPPLSPPNSLRKYFLGIIERI